MWRGNRQPTFILLTTSIPENDHRAPLTNPREHSYISSTPETLSNHYGFSLQIPSVIYESIPRTIALRFWVSPVVSLCRRVPDQSHQLLYYLPTMPVDLSIGTKMGANALDLARAAQMAVQPLKDDATNMAIRINIAAERIAQVAKNLEKFVYTVPIPQFPAAMPTTMRVD